MALAEDEQRELLAAVREIRSLVVEGAEAAPQERVAVQFAAWVAGDGAFRPAGGLMEALAAVLGADRARAGRAPAEDLEGRLL